MLLTVRKTQVKLIILQLILHCLHCVHSASQPPYQVSLYVSLHPRAPPIHYCNGVIVQSSLILTTASCVYYQSSVIEESGAPVRIPSSKISVVPGVAGTYNVLNTFNVLEINIAPGFNYKTLANNLALLRLDTTLPLGQRKDVQWIIMDDYVYEEKALYMAGFPSLNVDQNAMLLENVQILPNEQCAQVATAAPIISNESICARYPYTYSYAVGPDCEFPSDFPSFNTDYGTGLIVRSTLVALFSHTIATSSNQNTNNCREQQPFIAIFADVGPHVDWIYGIIASEEMLALHQNDFMYSAPYQQDVSSAIMYSSYASELMPSLIEAPTTTAAATTTTTTTITTAAAVMTTTNEVTTNPSSTEVSSTQPPCVSAADKVVGIKSTLLLYTVSYVFLAYFKK